MFGIDDRSEQNTLSHHEDLKISIWKLNGELILQTPDTNISIDLK
ncbi:MAG TPA: hypothetical protein VG895_01805 [Patescibacteria group bacterium]|nr:hypothetical protein [Patescibacteria group bacterium]